jgi:hypothetical protein
MVATRDGHARHDRRHSACAGVAALELDGEPRLLRLRSCDGDHARGEVETGDAVAQLGQQEREQAAARADVQHALRLVG